jgi:hypothetical protein
MYSQAYARYEKKISDIGCLLDIHGDISDGKRGRKPAKLRVLHKSAVVLLIAAWETYIESLLEDSMMFLSKTALAGPTGRIQYSLLQDVVKKSVEKELKRLNNPNSGAVRLLFKNLLGLADVTIAWKRQRLKSEPTATLDALIEARHRIVHGSISDPEFVKADVLWYKKYLTITVQKTDIETRRHLNFLTGENPW